jgi:putative ABC transport system permease protein
MRKVVLRGLLTRKLRSALTAVAILLGVAMISGTFVLTHQIDGAIDSIFSQADKGTDAVVLPHAHFGGQTGGGTSPVALYLPQSLVARVASATGVARAVGTLSETGYLQVRGKMYKPEGGSPSLLDSLSGPPFQVSTVISGHMPTAANEIAIDKTLAGRAHVSPGQRVQLVTATGIHQVTVSAVIKYPVSTGGTTIMLARLPDVQRWYTAAGKISRVDVAARAGVSQTQVAAAVRSLVGGPGVEVRTGKQDAKRSANAINKEIDSFLTPALLTFGFIAVFVGAFIIFNTFSITVAQRVREFGMLRALGATPGQVMRSVAGEALVIGVVASVIGIAGGFLVALAVDALFNAIGFGIPTSTPSIPLVSVVLGLLVGVGTTVVASIAPARRATKVSPVMALREGAVLPPSRFSRWSWILALVCALVGVLLIVNGFSSGGSTTNKLLGMAAGAVLVFIAVAMLTKYVVSPLVRVIGWPVARLTAGVGQIARENAMRNPARTAVTSSALMIGLAIVVFVTVFADGLKTGIGNAISQGARGNLVLESSGLTRIPGRVVPLVAGTPGIATASALYTDRIRLPDGDIYGIVGIDPANFTKVWNLRWIDGSDATLGRLGQTGFILDNGSAKDLHLHVGSTLTVEGLTGRHERLTLRGVYNGQNSPLGGFVVPLPAFDRISTNRDADVILANTAPGVSAAAGEARVTRTLRNDPIVQVQTTAEFTASQKDQLNPVIYLIYALLSMSVVISLFGIVNTLVLSVFERTREIGMLRAIGLTRQQTRRMVRYESVITSLIGALIGTVVGLFFGWVMAEGLKSQGIVFAVPIGQLVVFFVLAGVAGVLAAILPARRASRLNILEALQYE